MKEEVELGWEQPRRRGVVALAQRTGYSRTYISRVLGGKMKPGLPLARKLKNLGIKVEVA